MKTEQNDSNNKEEDNQKTEHNDSSCKKEDSQKTEQGPENRESLAATTRKKTQPVNTWKLSGSSLGDELEDATSPLLCEVQDNS